MSWITFFRRPIGAILFSLLLEVCAMRTPSGVIPVSGFELPRYFVMDMQVEQWPTVPRWEAHAPS